MKTLLCEIIFGWLLLKLNIPCDDGDKIRKTTSSGPNLAEYYFLRLIFMGTQPHLFIYGCF